MRLCQDSSHTKSAQFAARLDPRQQFALQGGLVLKGCHLIIPVSMQGEITYGFYDRCKDITKCWAWACQVLLWWQWYGLMASLRV